MKFDDLRDAWLDEAEFLKPRLIHLLTKHFGDKCETFDPDCIGCQRWQAMSILLADPYLDEESTDV